jgi:O-antigen/teichoic acid export membrane protein
MRRRSRAGLAGNTLILTTGTVVQTIVALVTVPLYLSQLGQERFGIWVIAGIVIAYFGLLDRGLGAAVQTEVARLDDDSAALRARLVWTGATFNALVGIVAALGVLLVGEILFARVIDIPGDLQAESVQALPAMAASVPLIAVSAVFQGVLMARGRVATVSTLETTRLLGLQLVPLAFVYWQGPDLRWLALGVLVVLVVATIVYVTTCAIVALRPHAWARPSREVALRLFHYGKWITATSVLTPLLDFSDRVVVGAVKGASAVTPYAIAYNLTTRMTIIPYNVIRVTFPRFSALSIAESQRLATSALVAVAAVTAPAAVIGSVISGPFFEWWLGGDVARSAAPVAAVLFAGFWINGLGYVPATLLQAQGRPDRPARFHALEIVPFLVILAVGVHLAGAMGAAIAWTLRVLFDGLLLLTVASIGWWENRRLLVTSTIVAAAAVVGAVFAFETIYLIVVGTPLVIASLVAGWLLLPEEFRGRIRRFGRGGRPRAGEDVGSSPTEPMT